MEEQPRDEQPKPDDEAEQAHHIDDGQSADAFLHELAEVRHHADGEEGEQEEDDKGESESLCRFLANTLTNGAVPVEENEAEEVAEPFDAEKNEQIGDEHEQLDVCAFAVEPLLDLLLGAARNPLGSR